MNVRDIILDCVAEQKGAAISEAINLGFDADDVHDIQVQDGAIIVLWVAFDSQYDVKFWWDWDEQCLAYALGGGSIKVKKKEQLRYLVAKAGTPSINHRECHHP